MYTIQKQPVFQDTLCLTDQSGESIEIEYSFRISPVLIQQYRKLQIALAELQKQTADNPSDQVLDEYGRCIVKLFSLLFGEENTTRILTFYQDDYTGMMLDLFPYIRNEIAPQLKKSLNGIKKNLRRRFS